MIIQKTLKKFNLTLTTLYLLSCLFIFSNENYAQDDLIRVDTDLVTIPVTVLDRDRRYITNLKKEDFQIFEDGIEQEITFFESVEKPFTIFVLLDVSSSMRPAIRNLANAANVFLEQLRPDDYLTAATFDEWVDVLFKVSTVKEIRKGKQFRLRVEASHGDTMVYDAVDFALKKIKKIRGRKAIVLFSDGIGSGIATSEKSTLRDAEEGEALIYTVQFNTLAISPSDKNRLSKASIDLGKQRLELANWYMRELAQKTGGRHFRIEDITDLEKTFGMIADELGQQYSLGYYPKNQGEAGQKRSIKVKVRQPNLAVKARESYIVGEQKNKKK